MALWTDIIDPVEATGIARVELEEYEREQSGTLARYLPNVPTLGDTVEFYVDSQGLIDPAQYRAFNAPPEIGGGGGLEKRVISLPAISRNEPIDEKTLRALKYLSDDKIHKSITAAIRRSAWSIGDRNEMTRGILIDTGKVVVNQNNFAINDDFGRDATLVGLTVGAASYWSDKTIDRIAQLNTYMDLYASKNNNQRPGAILMTRAAWSAFVGGNQFSTLLGNGATQPGVPSNVRNILDGYDLPMIDIYERKTKRGVILPANKIYFMPAPGPTQAQEASELGATYYGDSLMADIPGFSGTGDEPGMVVGTYREDRIPVVVEVQSDIISMPVAHNANAAMPVQVLA